MPSQYSDSPLTLAFDTGSPVTSVAIGRGDTIVALKTAPGGRASGSLLGLVQELLSDHGLAVGQLDRVLATRGPGSFTGLRVGLSTAVGLHQALGLPATAVGTLRALARAARSEPGDETRVAVVDALRGEWFAQPWTAGSGSTPLDRAVILEPERLLDWAPCLVTGFGLEALPGSVRRHPRARLLEAGPLAPALLAMASDPDLRWDPGRLVEPLYLRPPAQPDRLATERPEKP